MYAKCDMKAGTNLVIAKPIVICWDVEEEEEEDSEDDEEEGEEEEGGMVDSNDSGGDASVDSYTNKKQKALSEKAKSEEEATGTKRNGILILRTLEKINQSPTLWTNTLSKMYPRDIDTALSLPPWFCSDASIGMEIEMQMNKLSTLSLFPSAENEEVCKDIMMRLPLIIRYNVLSVETCSELFVYPDVSKGGMAGLAGTGLYGPEVSYFNHSCKPNVSRYCIGDVMFFVTNRDVAKGEELCFSYIEHEFLCENSKKRSALLDMDFELEDDDDAADGRPNKKQKVAKMPSKERGGTIHYPLIDTEMQSELMATPPMERLDLINELLDQKGVDPVQDYRCDKYQLHILMAITLDGLGKSREALPEWEMAIDFAVNTFPPLDETTVALLVQAALCALKDDRVKAKHHAGEALKMHNSLFGGGKERLLKRYEKELACPMRPIPKATIMRSIQELFG
ncbi:hypothetical protein ACHAXR_005800 [Thalassiosira sp. AJA248-18]